MGLTLRDAADGKAAGNRGLDDAGTVRVADRGGSATSGRAVKVPFEVPRTKTRALTAPPRHRRLLNEGIYDKLVKRSVASAGTPLTLFIGRNLAAVAKKTVRLECSALVPLSA
jgi:hypothetical protein